MDFIIRKMEPEDCALAAILETENFTDPWSQEGFLEELNNPDAIYYVAYVDHVFAGIAGLIDYCGDADIMNVSVKKDYRRQGIAEALLKHLMTEGMNKGVEAFTLEVRVSNEAAIHLYQKLGFIAEGIRPSFYRKPTEDALIMWKRDN